MVAARSQAFRMTSSLFPRSTLHHKLAGLVLGATLSLGFVSNASAKPEFPEALEKNLGLKCVPTCLLCHNDPAGGEDHLRDAQKSALYMLLAQETKPGDAQLQIVRAMDSDNDGVDDLTEIKAGRDPLVFGDSSICSPSYGCGARIAKPAAPQSDGSALLVSLGAAISLALWQRRRALSQSRK